MIDLPVMIAVIAMLVTFALPVLHVGCESARSPVCASNLRQMMQGCGTLMAARHQCIPHTYSPPIPQKDIPSWSASLARMMGKYYADSFYALAGRAWVECPTRREQEPITYIAWQFGYAASTRWTPGSPDWDPVKKMYRAANELQRWDLLLNLSGYSWFAEPYLRRDMNFQNPVAMRYFGAKPEYNRDLSHPHLEQAMNVAFADGHVRQVQEGEWEQPADSRGVPLWPITGVPESNRHEFMQPA
jgi:prepilin-type processing-associated H-X9-DG protein